MSGLAPGFQLSNVNELEKVTAPLTRLAPLATLSPKGARAGIQVNAPLAPLEEGVSVSRRTGEGVRWTLTM